MSAHKDKNGNWYIKYNNKTKRGFKSKREALLYEAKLKLENESHSIEPSTPIFDVANSYLDYYKMKVSNHTYKKAYSVINTIILPNIDNININKFNESHCKMFVEYIYNTSYCTAYKNYILRQFKCIFNYACKFYQLKENPTYIIESFNKTFEEKLKQKDKEMNIWNDNEFALFINEVKEYQYKVFFIVLYYTGLRLGEILALQWKDFDNKVLKIYKTIPKITNNGMVEVQSPKTASSIRDISLGKTLVTILDEYREIEKKQKGYSDDWYIFGRIKPFARATINRKKDNAIKLANVNRITIHEFRHSHASNLIGNGIDMVAVSRRLGHTDVNMTLKIYTHLLKKNDNDIVEFIDNSSQFLLTQ